MPNVIVELLREVRRVEALYPLLTVQDREQAQRIVHQANHNLASNQLEGMKESIDDLQAITGEKKP